MIKNTLEPAYNNHSRDHVEVALVWRCSSTTEVDNESVYHVVSM
jgi:uncharacterized tellurite resistance protein B-like protein